MLKLLPEWLKISASLIAGVLIAFYPARLLGRYEQRQAAQIEAARTALKRIQNLENNSAVFKKLSDYERRLVFMRYSGLPDRNCD